MFTRILLISYLLILSACASQPLTESEASIRILRKSDAPANCKELSKVHSPGFGAFSDQGREDNLKREVYKVGGNTVTVDKTDENNTIFGTAYKCN